MISGDVVAYLITLVADQAEVEMCGENVYLILDGGVPTD